ncbi:MAG: hypothetical protein JWP81_4550 [Ferruginibacter sp.]|nr:hypothetical protein [Ferruginibacter sp.]
MNQPFHQRSASIKRCSFENAPSLTTPFPISLRYDVHFLKVICFLVVCLTCQFSALAQDSVTKVNPDTSLSRLTNEQPHLASFKDLSLNKTLTDKQKKTRVWAVAATNITVYSAILVSLNNSWYTNYPRSSFHFFNDNKEWLQVDKGGHMFGAYIESRMSMELWRWTGIERKKRIWFGGLSGIVYQTIIETLDGFSTAWGWSWGDMAANTMGSGILIAQELAWDDQRVKLKLSFHKNDYGTDELNNRADKIYGKSLLERLNKDYNSLTIWASGNIHSFFPESKLPPWLSVAVGYGAEGLFGARENVAKDVNGNITFDRHDIKRYRQWYLAPDIDFTKIRTKKKGVKALLTLLSAFKMPAPSLEFSNGKFKLKALVF